MVFRGSLLISAENNLNTPNILEASNPYQTSSTLEHVSFSWDAQFVTGAPPGVDEGHAERLVNLPPQPINIDFYQFGKRVERIVPDVFGDFFAPDNFAGVARKVLK